MLFHVVFIIGYNFHLCLGKEISSNATCLTEPLTCSQAVTTHPIHQCVQDTDCPAHVRCCYVGCVRTCELIDPCNQVVCKPGFLCQVREIPCQKQPCYTEPTCLPEAEVRCPVLKCPTELCPAGQERVNDDKGCPTCKCKPKKECGHTCSIFCAYGKEINKEGCPICKCKAEPENPCTNKKCPIDQECRLVSQPSCEISPCKARATCVTKLRPKYDNSCSLKDKTTLGKPILQSDQVTELDCYNVKCPDGSVCTKFGATTHRCCMQYSQEQIWVDTKPGECPPGNGISASNNSPQSCTFDGQCPGDLKCCYGQSLQTQPTGTCVVPAHNVSLSKFIQCQTNSVLSSFLYVMGLC